MHDQEMKKTKLATSDDVFFDNLVETATEQMPRFFGRFHAAVELVDKVPLQRTQKIFTLMANANEIFKNLGSQESIGRSHCINMVVLRHWWLS